MVTTVELTQNIFTMEPVEPTIKRKKCLTWINHGIDRLVTIAKVIRANVSDNARVMDVIATPVVVQIVAALTVFQGAIRLAMITEDAQYKMATKTKLEKGFANMTLIELLLSTLLLNYFFSGFSNINNHQAFITMFKIFFCNYQSYLMYFHVCTFISDLLILHDRDFSFCYFFF